MEPTGFVTLGVIVIGVILAKAMFRARSRAIGRQRIPKLFAEIDERLQKQDVASAEGLLEQLVRIIEHEVWPRVKGLR